MTTAPHRYEFQIYIGDTDAYAMTYHTNYIKYYQRALFEALLDKQRIALEDTIELSQIVKQNFTKVAKLGDRVTIVTSVAECGDAVSAVAAVSAEQEFFVNGVSMNNMSSVFRIFRKHKSDVSDAVATIPNMATTTTLPPPPVSTARATEVCLPRSHTCLRIRAYTDMFDYNQRLSIPRVVDLFERSRNNAFGGPDKLSELKLMGVHVIVVTIQKMINHTLERSTPKPQIGSQLEVRNRLTVSMNGKRLTFGHQLVAVSEVAEKSVLLADADNSLLLVECEIVVYCVDQATHTLKELPAAVLRELEPFR